MKSNQKGIAVIAIILLIVLVSLIGATGWYVYSSNKKTSESLANAQKATNSTVDSSKKATATAKPSIAPSPTPNLGVNYTSKVLGLSLVLPNGWQATENSEGKGTLTIKTPDYEYTVDGLGSEVPTKGAKITISTDPTLGKKLEETEMVKMILGYLNTKSTKTKIGSKDALEYTWAFEGPQLTTVSYILGNNVVHATYLTVNNSHAEPSYTEYKKMLETIK